MSAYPSVGFSLFLLSVQLKYSNYIAFLQIRQLFRVIGSAGSCFTRNGARRLGMRISGLLLLPISKDIFREGVHTTSMSTRRTTGPRAHVDSQGNEKINKPIRRNTEQLFFLLARAFFCRLAASRTNFILDWRSTNLTRRTSTFLAHNFTAL